MEEYGLEGDIWNVVQHEKPKNSNLTSFGVKVIF
jgi:hypothetical protein